jgi:predicted transcriptional regulator
MKRIKIFTEEAEAVRIKLKKYLQETGIMQKQISLKTDIAAPTLCVFLSGKKPLDDSRLEVLKEYLDTLNVL